MWTLKRKKIGSSTSGSRVGNMKGRMCDLKEVKHGFSDVRWQTKMKVTKEKG